MKSILLKLSGPLQSWGTNSHFETRHTDVYPSKSAIIGMIAASLGYRRDQDEQIKNLNELEFAVRIDQPGELMRDYQIARMYKKNGSFERNYVTNRYYLEDAIFVVGIGSHDEHLIDSICFAIQNPYFQMFLGRRSNPITYDFYLGLFNTDVISSLTNYPWQASAWYKKKCSDDGVMVYADSCLLTGGIRHTNKDNVISFCQKERKFYYRQITSHKIFLAKMDKRDEHDVIRSLGG